MSKKTVKIISTITLIVCCIMCFTVCMAEVNPSNIKGDDANVNTANIESAGNQIATFIRNVGIVVAVLILMTLGIKYMMGSAEEKAEYKKTMIPYVVGAVLLFSASALATAVIDLAKGITGSQA